jgi:sialate O-acetylesterase
MEASQGGAAVTVTATLDSGDKISITDVLIGDVWVCSGQSNMAFTVSVPTNDLAAEASDVSIFPVSSLFSRQV